MANKSIITKTKAAIMNFMPVVGKSAVRVIADVAAVEAGLTPGDVTNFHHEGKEASGFIVNTGTSKELHAFVRESARMAYIITTTPNNLQQTPTSLRVFDVQMPQNQTGGWGGDGATSSSKKK